VFVRVGRFVAFMIYGHVGDPDPSEAALLRAALDQTATRLAALEAARTS